MNKLRRLTLICLSLGLGGVLAATGDGYKEARIKEISQQFSTAVLEVSSSEGTIGCRGEFYYAMVINGVTREVVPAEFLVLNALDATHVIVQVTTRKGNVHSSYRARILCPPAAPAPTTSPTPPPPPAAGPAPVPLVFLGADVPPRPAPTALPTAPPYQSLSLPQPIRVPQERLVVIQSRPFPDLGTAWRDLLPALVLQIPQPPPTPPVAPPPVVEAPPRPTVAEFVADMARIPGGLVALGIDPDACRFYNETPVHTVELETYYLDQHEVTQAEYARFIEETGHPAPPDWAGGQPERGHENLPVVYVSWHDANAFARWAHKRLPTEAEWEYAGRGPQNFLFPWGNEFREKAANTSEAGSPGLLPHRAFPEDTSPFGVGEMAGNVNEWTASRFSPYPRNAYLDRDDYSEGARVIRGGAFNVNRVFCRLVFRARKPETYRGDDLGFRCAISLADLRRLQAQGVLKATPHD